MWLGLAVTGFFLWLVLRDAPLSQVARVIARADYVVLIGLSVPSYLLAVYLRALRWRYLTDPLQPIGTGPLSRAVAVGFMANNVFPLRIGEFVRSWYLARETGASATAIFGTVILERVIDIAVVIGLGIGVIALLGASGDRAMARGAALLLPLAIVPAVALVGLRAAPERVIGLMHSALRPLPERVPLAVERLLRRFSEGLGALRRGSHLVWIVLYSAGIWLVAGAVPIWAGFVALGIELGSPLETLVAAWVTLAAVGIAVALPSAPGFFGPYHYACRLALERFGVPAETAVALGTVVHAVFWVTLTLLGLLVLRLRRTSLGELDRAAGGSPGPPPR